MQTTEKEVFENMIKNKVNSFYQKIEKIDNHRYKSWEHCYSIFRKKYKKMELSDDDYDLLSLNLAFYLASWGMYRGSSFILQRDYKLFKELIKELHILYKLERHNKIIENVIIGNINRENKKQIIKTINEIGNQIDNCLRDAYDGVRGNANLEDENLTSYQPEKNELSETLKTKIILGIFGIIPAYDRFFKAGIKYFQYIKEQDKFSPLNNTKNLSQTYNNNGLDSLLDFVIEFKELFEKLDITIENKHESIRYPIMKNIDMFFWVIGYEMGLISKQINEIIKDRRKIKNVKYSQVYPKLIEEIEFPKIKLEYTDKDEVVLIGELSDDEVVVHQIITELI